LISEEAAAPVRSGDIVAGRYRVERVLGRGGMGVVVAARHVQLQELVAIKFPLPRVLARSDLAARVVREGQAAARLRGEHVARVLDVGTLETGEPFLVLEHLRGQDLGAVLRERGPLPVAGAVELVLQACEALAEAHSAGIVHRDIKPGNLFLTHRPDGSPSIKIIDFGVAKTESHGGLTSSGAVIGTPHYMSPEQMRDARDVDARADVWALGAVLFCLVTGKPPMSAPSVAEMYQLALRGAPRLRSVLASAPDELDEAIARCLSLSPEGRFPDVAALAAAIAPFGPAGARASAERCARILARGREESPLLPPRGLAPDAPTSPPETAAPSERTFDARSGSWGDRPTAEAALEKTSSAEVSAPVPAAPAVQEVSEPVLAAPGVQEVSAPVPAAPAVQGEAAGAKRTWRVGAGLALLVAMLGAAALFRISSPPGAREAGAAPPPSSAAPPPGVPSSSSIEERAAPAPSTAIASAMASAPLSGAPSTLAPVPAQATSKAAPARPSSAAATPPPPPVAAPPSPSAAPARSVAAPAQTPAAAASSAARSAVVPVRPRGLVDDPD
jgi:serine/threonine-protein kinase